MANLQTFGIDISSYSLDIDWHKVANNIRPRFIFARAYHIGDTPATTMPDDRFGEYWSAAAALNIPRGAYLFCDPTADAADSVAKFYSVYSPKVGDLVPTLDIEDAYDNSSVVPLPKRIAQIQTMIDRVSAKIGGQKPLIYTKKRVWDDLGSPPQFANCPLWVMNYNTMPVPGNLPASWSTFAFWQCAENIKDNSLHQYGVTGDYDLNLFNGPESDLSKFCITQVS